jgi:hypothetical protein
MDCSKCKGAIMHRSSPFRPRHLLLAASGSAALLAGAAFAQVGTPVQGPGPSLESAAITRGDTTIDDSGVYQRELQACMSGWSHQARETCLEEARNSRAAALRGRLALPGEDYRANALARCEPLAGEDRAACEARVMGFGGSSGSVAGGGLLRWVETLMLPPHHGPTTYVPQTAEPAVVIVAPRR